MDEDVLAELAELAGLKVVSLQSIGNQAEWRREWRINANTGNLVGVVFRERNKGRKAVRYVGKRSKGERKAEFERYANGFAGAKRGRANGSSIGNDLYGGKASGEALPSPNPNRPFVGNKEVGYLH